VRPAASSSNSSNGHAFVAEGGAVHEPTSSPDPFNDLDDLMVVVEALCPVWPQREPFQTSGTYLL
jgi:hypothetical protein